MRRPSHLDDVDGDHIPRRARRYDDRILDLRAKPDQSPDSPPHAFDDGVHSSPRRTTSRRRRYSSLRSPEPNEYFAAASASSTMPPPSAPAPVIGLTRSATDAAYRRPVNCLAPDDRYEVPLVRRHSARDVSPGYGRTRGGAEYSAHSSATSGLAYGDDYDCDHIEVVEELEEEPARYRERGQSSRDEYIESSSDRRYRRRRRKPYGDEDGGSRRYYAASEGGSAAIASSRTPDRSVSSRRERVHHVPDVIEDSRPPISSNRPLVHRRHRSAEIIQLDQPKTRRFSRSRAGSVSGGPSSIIGSIFGAQTVRQESPDKHLKEAKVPKKRVDCVICMGDVSTSKASKLRCGHYMCRPCLERIFRLSVTDPQHMPPRCCTTDHIPLKHVERLFDHAFKKTWNRKFAEYSTKNRVYCPARKCGEWIKPSNIKREDGRKVGRCSRCRTKVCCACNTRWHGATSCPNDPETADILAQAKEEGWKRCYRCKALVELKEGCNHMTCRCGAEFCMICGIKWKNCDCPWFNDDDRRADFLNDMNIPIPSIRGDLGDIFRGNGPPAPPELRGHTEPPPMMMPVRRRPRTYQEEMHMRRQQESFDADFARQLQYTGDYDEPHSYSMMGGLGDIHGIGNASEHYMNENYRRGGHYRPQTQTTAVHDRPEYGDTRRSRGRLETSQERRLADRLSETRSGFGSPPAAGPIYPVGMSVPPPPVPAAPVPIPPSLALRHHTVEAEMYNISPYTPRAERVVGRRMSRDYEDEARVHSPPRSHWRRGRETRPKSSELAGLNGTGQGMNRVSQWRTFVEPGIPDGESTVGHA
ncbi:revertant of glycogen synthase kinase mutation [Metarhizium robertsii ARSEF 23]|uniref:RBR-type E3 ubiquitin transferase n=1 Tax=Metarhizium robertsii (strain ARSEF 23 / ATCC MYA-3075) TaxID=655844 RepID=E9F2M5_METRA|nr:revertant of glycogen synthase kinase mutation [Metarhizium robertsii ARSEF 23]EFY98314.2 revertant of glycogen synthase kinase mutation [Metarhizium robertsii ARSEF 23]